MAVTPPTQALSGDSRSHGPFSAPGHRPSASHLSPSSPVLLKVTTQQLSGAWGSAQGRGLLASFWLGAVNGQAHTTTTPRPGALPPLSCRSQGLLADGD